MKHRILAWIMAAVLTVGLLPTAAWAAGEDWEHNDHTDWTALTTEKLSELDYTLTTGKYYLSGTEQSLLPGQVSMDISNPITVTGNVTLCLNNVSYTYTGSEQSAIVVQEGASLTICCCKEDDSNYLGGISSNSVPYTVSNSGTLHTTSGAISSGVPVATIVPPPLPPSGPRSTT